MMCVIGSALIAAAFVWWEVRRARKKAGTTRMLSGQIAHRRELGENDYEAV